MYLSVAILLWSTALKPVFAKAVKPGESDGLLGFSTILFNIPGVHGAIEQAAPIVTRPTPVKAVFTWNILGASGTAILVAVLVTVLFSKISWKAAFEELSGTWKQLWLPILMICFGHVPSECDELRRDDFLYRTCGLSCGRVLPAYFASNRLDWCVRDRISNKQ